MFNPKTYRKITLTLHVVVKGKHVGQIKSN